MLICLNEGNPLLLYPSGWGCHSDRFIDIWRERRRGAGSKGWGWRRRRGWVLVWGRWRSVFQMSLCVSSVNQPSVSVWAQWRNSSWTFLNQAAVRRHLGWARGLIPVMVQKTQPVQGRYRQIIRRKCVLLNWSGRLCSHFAVSGRSVVYTNDQSALEKQTYRCFRSELIRLRWCNQPFSQPEDSLTMDRENGREERKREREGGREGG